MQTLPLLSVFLTMQLFSASASGPSIASPPDGRFIRGQYTDEHGAREYRLYFPSGSEDGRPRPLLVMLHGCTQDAEDFARGTRMNEVAEEEEFFVLYPEQAPGAHEMRCWNWYDPAQRMRDHGELALIAGMTREIVAGHPVDPARVYVAGISAGGIMALEAAAGYPELFAAAGAHSALSVGSATGTEEALAVMRGGAPDGTALGEAVLQRMGDRARALPLILFHGAEDAVVAPVNALQLAAQWRAAAERLVVPLSEEVVEDTTDGVPYRLVRYADRDGRVRVESWMVGGLGHAWSGGSETGTYTQPGGPDASREIVRFLLGHSRGGDR